MTTGAASQPARLTAIELENFKGISDRVRVDLKPITLLFGANSAGKSTILQALQYVREVLERRNANPDRTLYGGDFVDLGGFRNLVHGRDLSRRIAIKLELTLNDDPLPDLTPEPWEDWQADLSGDPDSVWRLHQTLAETRNKASSVSVRVEIGWSALRQTAVVVGYEAGINAEWLAHVQASEDGRDVSFRFNSFNPVFIRERPLEYLEMMKSFQTDLDSWIKSADIGAAVVAEPDPAMADDDDVDFEDLATAVPGKEGLYTIFPEILVAARDAGLAKPGEGLRGWLKGFDSALPRLDQLLAIPSLGLGPAIGNSGSANVYMQRDFEPVLRN